LRNHLQISAVIAIICTRLCNINHAEKQYDEILIKTEQINQKQTDHILDDSFSFSELRRAIRETKKDSAPGDDGISYEMLQHLSKRSTKFLLELYNRVWSEGKMPQDWRHSIVKPVNKPSRHIARLV